MGLIPGSGRFPGEGNGNPLFLTTEWLDGSGMWLLSQCLTEYFHCSAGHCSLPPLSLLVPSHFSRVWLFAAPPGSSVHGILQARTLEWVAIPFSRGSSWPRDPTRVSCIGREVLYCRATWKSLLYRSLPSVPRKRWSFGNLHIFIFFQNVISLEPYSM